MKMKKRDTVLGILLIIFLQAILLVSAVSTSTVCAIKTTYGATCQDVPSNQVNTNYPSYNTACASVPTCSGTCVDPITGLCASSSKYACTQGTYYSTTPDQTSQCQYKIEYYADGQESKK